MLEIFGFILFLYCLPTAIEKALSWKILPPLEKDRKGFTPRPVEERGNGSCDVT